MFARSATQQQSMSRFKKCKTLCESPSQKNTLHLVVQVNTNPILYLQVCYKYAYIHLFNYLIYSLLLLLLSYFWRFFLGLIN